MFDVILQGRRIAIGNRLVEGSIGIQDGVITALMAPECEAQARERIDAGDDLVLPGLIDAHVHFREPGMAHKEGFANGTKVAAAGGVTTVLVMPTDRPITFTPEDFSEKQALASSHSYVDVGLQAAVGRDLTHLPKLAGLGAVSFEIFLADQNPALRLDDGASIAAALQAVKSTGLVAGITPGEHTIVESLTSELQSTGATAPQDFPRAWPPMAEAMGLARAAAAAVAIGTEVVFRQTSCRASVETLRPFQRLGRNLHSEVNPQYLYLTEEALRTFGPFAVMSPPLRTDDDIASLWDALFDGTVELISTDHAPHLPDEKQIGASDIWKTPRGIPGLQTMLPLLLGSAQDGRCSYLDIVKWCAERPARLFGLYPKKGVIAPGADADLVIIDTGKRAPIDDASQLSRASRTPFAGQRSGGAVKLVMLRGDIVLRDGKFTDRPRGQVIRPI